MPVATPYTSAYSPTIRRQTTEVDNEEYIISCMEWIARSKTQLDQKEKEFNDQYPMKTALVNRFRLEALESKKLEIEIHEYELGGFIKDYLDQENDHGQEDAGRSHC